LGPAGSGKTTLARTLALKLIADQGSESVVTVNLDPGSDDSDPWTIDVRERITLVNVMKKYKLGPNGAMVKAFELMEREIDPMLDPICQSMPAYVIIDAPGQLDPLIFSEAGNAVMKKMKEKLADVTGIFLIPADIINTPAGYAFLVLLLTGLRLKLDIPLLHVISKADLLEDSTDAYLNNPDELINRLDQDTGEIASFSIASTEIVKRLLPTIHPVKVSIAGRRPSAKIATGLDDLIDLVHESKCACGDLT
jgi:hypothetical protein